MVHALRQSFVCATQVWAELQQIPLFMTSAGAIVSIIQPQKLLLGHWVKVDIISSLYPFIGECPCAEAIHRCRLL